jgi:hypothetical protein
MSWPEDERPSIEINPTYTSNKYICPIYICRCPRTTGAQRLSASHEPFLCDGQRQPHLEEGGQRGAGGAKVGVRDDAAAQPGADEPLLRLGSKPLVGEDDGAIVVAVPDHAAHGLVHGPAPNRRHPPGHELHGLDFWKSKPNPNGASTTGELGDQ